MNKRGQALVEFVLILPILLLIILAVYDFGMIFSNRNELENDSTDIVLLYKNGTTIEEIKNMYNGLMVETRVLDDYEEIIVSKNVRLKTPGFNLIFGNPYKIVVSRYINYE